MVTEGLRSWGHVCLRGLHMTLSVSPPIMGCLPRSHGFPYPRAWRHMPCWRERSPSGNREGKNWELGLSTGTPQVPLLWSLEVWGQSISLSARANKATGSTGCLPLDLYLTNSFLYQYKRFWDSEHPGTITPKRLHIRPPRSPDIKDWSPLDDHCGCYHFSLPIPSIVCSSYNNQLLILLHLPPECCDYIHVPRHPICGSGDRSQGLRPTEQGFYRLSYSTSPGSHYFLGELPQEGMAGSRISIYLSVLYPKDLKSDCSRSGPSAYIVGGERVLYFAPVFRWLPFVSSAVCEQKRPRASPHTFVGYLHQF